MTNLCCSKVIDTGVLTVLVSKLCFVPIWWLLRLLLLSLCILFPSVSYYFVQVVSMTKFERETILYLVWETTKLNYKLNLYSLLSREFWACIISFAGWNYWRLWVIMEKTSHTLKKWQARDQLFNMINTGDQKYHQSWT